MKGTAPGPEEVAAVGFGLGRQAETSVGMCDTRWRPRAGDHQRGLNHARQRASLQLISTAVGRV